VNEPSTNRSSPERRVWDLPVRIFHWALVVAVLGAYGSHYLSVTLFKVHLWFGYAVLVLVSFRILWGLFGTRHARFWHFLRGPITIIRYAVDMLMQRDRHYAGHNPLGAWMVMALLLALLAQAITGLYGNDEIFNFGPLYGYISNDQSIYITGYHRQLFYWIVGAIALHIAAVVYHRVARGENLVRSMFTGRKPEAHVQLNEAIGSSRLPLALFILAVVIGVLAWVVQHAPEAQAFSSFN
jgi:cytochrome b